MRRRKKIEAPSQPSRRYSRRDVGIRAVGFSQAKDDLAQRINEAETFPVLITRHGKPAALLIGVRDEFLEDLLRASPAELTQIIKRKLDQASVAAMNLPSRSTTLA